MRARCRQAVKLKPVSVTNRRLRVRELTAAQEAHSSSSRASAGSAISARAMRCSRGSCGSGRPKRSTGTVGAFLVNATAFSDPTNTPAVRDAALRDIEEALPALQVLGLFEVLEIRDPKLRAFVDARIAATTEGAA